MLRNTIQRQIVLSTVCRLRSHPAAEEICREIEREYGTSISKATVYRNLHQLVDAGRLRQLSLPGSPERYDGQTHWHAHFRCRQCGMVADLEVEVPHDLGLDAAEQVGFRIEDSDLVFKGLCAACAE